MAIRFLTMSEGAETAKGANTATYPPGEVANSFGEVAKKSGEVANRLAALVIP